MCISVDLPGARRPHDGDELAARDVERDAPQGVDGGVALAVAAGQVVGADNLNVPFELMTTSVATASESPPWVMTLIRP